MPIPGHDLYERLPRAIKGEVDTAFKHATDVLRSAGLNPANDDRAERLVAAITLYVLESTPRVRRELLPIGYQEPADAPGWQVERINGAEGRSTLYHVTHHGGWHRAYTRPERAEAYILSDEPDARIVHVGFTKADEAALLAWMQSRPRSSTTPTSEAR